MGKRVFNESPSDIRLRRLEEKTNESARIINGYSFPIGTRAAHGKREPAEQAIINH